jgi:N-acetylmuramoyl-L-alanine amidase
MLKRTHRCFTAEIAKSAEKIFFLCVLCALCGFFPVVAVAAPPVRTMYGDAMAREQTVRAAMNAPEAAPAVLADVRAVVAAYEAIVRHYPASGYSDNALWQAGRLSIDAFTRFGQASDKDAGVRILRKLAATYPTSKLVKQVPEQLTRAEQAPPPPSRGPLATIKEIRRAVLPDAVRITIELDSEVAFHDERIQDPARVFVDLPGTRAVPSLVDQTLRFEGDADIVRQVRVGRHPNNTTRVVLDAAGITSYSVYPLYSPYRLVIDCVRVPAAVAAAAMTDTVLARVAPAALPAAQKSNDGAAAAAARPTAPLSARTMTNPWLRKFPGSLPRATELLALARQSAEGATMATAALLPAATPAPAPPAVEAAPVANVLVANVPAASAPAVPRPSAERATAPARHGTEIAATAAPAHNATGGLSIARQLGLGVSRIVIDPGHGGHDPGAKGKGVTEAELVLDVALRLEKLLQKVSGVEVILTRRSDEFIPLPERTAIANREGADLFLSIHANASLNGQAHGIETYFLNFANNQSAAAVAARENAASTQAMGGLPDFVKAIAMNNKLDESRDLALHVQRSMVERQRAANKALKDLGVKQAPFVVLIGANMPSVLAEMGFVTNPQEGKLLKANAYRQKIAESLFNAIRKYQTSLKSVSTVAHE